LVPITNHHIVVRTPFAAIAIASIVVVAFAERSRVVRRDARLHRPVKESIHRGV
jgi:hypothetical protein